MSVWGKRMAIAGTAALAGILLTAPQAPAKRGGPIKVDQGYGQEFSAEQNKPPCAECEKQRRMHPERYAKAGKKAKPGKPSRSGGKQGYAKHKPPPWAPAHGRRAKYMYRYYPRSRVYFDPGRNLWFWPAGEKWRSGRDLPRSIRLNTSGMVKLGMDVDKPYSWHIQVQTYFPPPR